MNSAKPEDVRCRPLTTESDARDQSDAIDPLIRPDRNSRLFASIRGFFLTRFVAADLSDRTNKNGAPGNRGAVASAREQEIAAVVYFEFAGGAGAGAGDVPGRLLVFTIGTPIGPTGM